MKKEIVEQEETHNIELPNEKEDVRSFRLDVNDGEFFDNDFVLKVRLPQYGLLNHVHSQQILNGSSVVLTLAHGPNVAKNLHEAIQKPLEKFNIQFLLNDEVYSTWKLDEAIICGVSFGEISKIGHDEPGLAFIECEVVFKSLDIDGTIV